MLGVKAPFMLFQCRHNAGPPILSEVACG
uniref:Uncharacterized protein n=1 Tax=Anguilla anguilla TaxID=7936 RepID=A0A0E9VII2_ANGAN